MAQMLGIPNLKGNSQEIIVCKLSSDFDVDTEYFETCAVTLQGDQGGGVQPIVGKFSDNPAKWFGFAFDLDKKTGLCSVVRRADAVALNTNGTAGDFAIGDQITVDGNGMVNQAATVGVNGIILRQCAGISKVDSVRFESCVMVSFDAIAMETTGAV